MHCVIEAFVEDDAKLSVITLTERNPHVVSIRARSRVGASAAVHWHATTLGNDVTHDLRSRIVGDHGTSNVDWIFHALDRDKHRVSVTNAFEGRDGGGEITMKGVAQDRASVRCYGLIDIGLHGGGTDTYLTENVLMLDATSIIDAIPALEIKTNDVKASHSATVSRVTEEDLFYFAARGIQQQEARKMYIEGFLNALIERVESSRIADALQASLCFSK
jgi:Fe-S cluster assembly scaffold protein SufB